MKTLAELQASDKMFLTPAEISGVLGSDPQTIRVTARQRPDRIGFDFTFVGNRMKIPRSPFLRWVLGASAAPEKEAQTVTDEPAEVAP